MSLTSIGRAAALSKSAAAQTSEQPSADTQPVHPDSQTERPEGQPTVPSATQAKAGFIGQLLAYIPSDALAAYVALTAFILDSSSFWRFLAFIGVAIATPVWVVIAYRDTTDDPAVLKRWPVFQMVVGSLAFIAWSSSVPGSWWQADLDLSAQAGGGIAVASSIVLGLVVTYYQQQHRVDRLVLRTQGN